jgi:hypothetical protein
MGRFYKTHSGFHFEKMGMVNPSAKEAFAITLTIFANG